ncbi:MAG: Hsp20/alpha crystallin family protein [Gorillibacterium sp.]|nr:Hsp20/alpha crystallin family protein [Gorillibacterium sp.]
MSSGHSRSNDKRWRAQAVQVLGEDFWDDLAGVLPSPGPRTDLYRYDGQLIAVMELPGVVAPDSLTVSLTDKWLQVSGEIPYAYPVNEEELLRTERSIGRFSRKLPLPDSVNPDEVNASYRNGLLILRMSLKAETSTRTVAVSFEETSDGSRGNGYE